MQGGCLHLRTEVEIVKTISNGPVARVLVICCIAILAAGGGCDPGATKRLRNEASQPMKNIDEVIKMYSDSLLAISGVVGVYHGLNEDGRSCLKVMVKRINPEVEGRIPKKLEGYDVVIEETGEIKPMK